MSKKIDFSKPLSEEDEAYVAERPWLRVDAELSGFDLSEETDFSVDDGDDPDEDPDGFDGGDGDGEGEDSDGDSDEDESDEGEEGDEDEVAPYAEWEFPALQAEAKSRNLNAKGSKEQLIERLEQDDASAQE